MHKATSLIVASALWLALPAAYGETPATAPAAPVAKEAASQDLRQLATLPDQARQLMRTDMLDHLAALNEIFGYLAEGKLAVAAEVAEKRMGNSSMGKHRATGMGPGRFMPLEMRNLGWGMHDAASEFSRIAAEGDTKKTYAALQKLTGTCVACHYSYRTQ